MSDKWGWQIWIRHTGSAVIIGTALMVTSNTTAQVVGCVIFLAALVTYLARWRVYVSD